MSHYGDPWAARNLSDDSDFMGPLVIDQGGGRRGFDPSLFGDGPMSLPTDMPGPATKGNGGPAPESYGTVAPAYGGPPPSYSAQCPPGMAPSRFDPSGCYPVAEPSSSQALPPELPPNLDFANARPMPPAMRDRGVNIMVCVFLDGTSRVYR